MKIGRYLGERMGGAIRFVRGGWLVGDLERDEKPDVDVAGANEEASVEGNKSDGSRRGDQKPKKEKKRKASSSSEKAGDGDNERKRKKKLRKTHTDDANKTTREEEGALATSEEVSELADSTDIEPRKRKKSKEDSQRTRDAGEAGGERAEEAKKKRKSKNAGEGEKAKKNRKSRDADETVEGEITDKKTKKKRRRKDEEGETEGLPSERVGHQTTFVSVKHVEITTSTGSASGSGTSTPLHTRHLVRSRNIASKRMALMDSEALNQVCVSINNHDGTQTNVALPDIHDKVTILRWLSDSF